MIRAVEDASSTQAQARTEIQRWLELACHLSKALLNATCAVLISEFDCGDYVAKKAKTSKKYLYETKLQTDIAAMSLVPRFILASHIPRSV